MTLASIAGVDAPVGGGGGALSDQMPLVTTDNVSTGGSDRPSLTATASATPHTVGGYQQIDASLSEDVMGLFFNTTVATGAAVVDTSSLIEIGIGAASSETVWATFGIGYRPASTSLFIPGFIAAGTRVAFRARSAVVSKTISGCFAFASAKSIVPSAPVSMGVNTSTSNGATATYSGTLNVKSGWVEIEASTPSDFGLLAIFSQMGTGDTDIGSSGMAIDIGIGAASAETVLIPDYTAIGASANETVTNYNAFNCFGVDIPAGSRLSFRYGTNNVNNGSMGMTLVGA